jgi:calcineurin-like phosphoesterase family protein
MSAFNPDKLFFTADTHFGHEAIIRHCSRPVADAAEMDDWIVHNWNAVVPKDSVIWHLGDVSFAKPERTAEVLSRLNGRKFLVEGNHDKAARLLPFFAEIHKLHQISVDGQKIVMCHFPLQSWNAMHHGSWHFHGHSHGNMKSFGLRQDVGWDVYKMPVSFRQLQAEMKLRNIDSHDHHQPVIVQKLCECPIGSCGKAGGEYCYGCQGLLT